MPRKYVCVKLGGRYSTDQMQGIKLMRFIAGGERIYIHGKRSDCWTLMRLLLEVNEYTSHWLLNENAFIVNEFITS